MLHTVQVGKGTLARDLMLLTVQWGIGVVRERPDIRDSARGKDSVGRDVMLIQCRGKGIVRGRRVFSDSAMFKGVFRERRDVTVQGGKWSFGREAILLTAQGEMGRLGET